jgi:ubiquitin-protein ligase
MKASAKLLMNQFGEMKKEPIEGIFVDLVDEDNVYEWDVFIAGPPDTVYEGGIFRLRLKFPQDYPFSPPTLLFKSKFWVTFLNLTL